MLIDVIFFILILLAFVKGLNKAKGFAVLLYLLLYLLIYTIVLFYIKKYGLISEETLSGSRTYEYIISWGMKAIDGLRGFFP